MGFYGNITNTSRTQFSFDKIYPNKYEMFNNAETDGIYVGRYVLVEYDLDTGADTYYSTLYKYGNNMYSTIEIAQDKNGQKFILPPKEQNKITINNNANIKKGSIVRLYPEHNLYISNGYSFYIKILNVYDKESNIVSFSYTTDIDKNELSHCDFNCVPDLTSEEFEPGYYYIKIDNNEEDEEEYQLAEEYNENIAYYTKGYGEKLYFYHSVDNGFLGYLDSPDLSIFTEGAIFLIRKGYQYFLNTEEELWRFADVDNNQNIIWSQIISSTESNYYKNFNIDKVFYPNGGRGYDSTVWQKVYHSGKQYYIMIAELNTVLPNLDITSEFPTPIPRQPYFSPDTTNMYYKISIQPQWGLRTKAANPSLLGDKIEKNGMPNGFSSIKLTADEIVYPSDVYSIWNNQFYNKNTDRIEEMSYNVKMGLWKSRDLNEKDDDYKVKSAIYFNKNGFNLENISYSGDLINGLSPNYNNEIAESGWENYNIIQLAPTGYSGYTYRSHNESSEQIPQIDTQELSIMIPSLGDSVAQMWDIIYGGRETNDKIKENNKRNLDIFWEPANNSIIRSGLRLVRDVPEQDGFIQSYDNAKYNFNGEVINLGEINTLAGCINSVHDLMGMILVNTTENELQEESKQLAELNIFKDYKNIDGSKIYYFANDGTYRRKHETFEYSELRYIYEPIIVTNENFVKNFYYYSLDNGETFIPSYEDEFDENKNYYIKKIDTEASDNQIFIEVNNLKHFRSGEKHFPYQKTLNGDFIYDINLYAKDEDTIYYNVTNVSSNKTELAGNYEPNKYYFYDSEDETKIYLSQAKEASDIQYYSVTAEVINHNIVENIDMADDIGVYLYCPGFFYYKQYALLDGIPDIDDVNNYYKEVNIPIESHESELYENENKIYVPLIENEDYTINGNEVRWDSNLYENGIIKIYIETDNLLLDQNPLMTKDREYYVVYREVAGKSSVVIEDEETGALIPAISTTAYNITKYRIEMKPYLSNRYYRIGSREIVYQNQFTGEKISEDEYNELNEEVQINDYFMIQTVTSYEQLFQQTAQEALTNDYKQQFKQEQKRFIDYYDLDINRTETFYSPNQYWYNTYQDKLNTLEEKNAWENGTTDNDKFAYGDWVIDTNKKMTEGRQYYLNVIATKESGPFYRPGDYYYYDNDLNEYVLDMGATIQENITYYKKNSFYILEDKTGHFSKGAIWNYYNTAIPCTLKIASRKSIYEMQELIGFSRTLNTIHGLILKINDLLEIDDKLTRNTKTVQGCINTLNDIINKFDELKFNKMLVTDEIGRIVTKDLKDLEVAYGLNYSKKMTLSQMLNKFDEIENKVNNFIFITDEEMNSILEN